MADEIRDAKDGLSTRLSTISGLRVLDYATGSVNEFPSAVVLFESRNAAETLGGSTFAGRIKVILLVSVANTQEAFDTDATWGGNVDDGRLISIDSVGRRKLWGGFFVSADFHFRFVKQVSG